MKVVDFPSQKEVNASPASPKRIKESVPKYFIDETSFLSESADVAPDANSVVLKSEIISKMVSQSSICFDGLPERNVGSVMTSQDIVMSCSQLFADPLCSVVPCSISSENASPLDLQNRTGREDDSRRCCISTPEPGVQALQDTSYLNVGNDQGNGQEMNVVRRQLTSFKTYSTPLSDLNFCNQFPSEGHRGLLSGEHNISGIAYPHKRSSIGSIPFRYETQVVARDDEKNHENVDLTETEFVVRGDGKNHKIVMTENPILEKVNDERNCEELRTDPAELVMQALKERKFPFVVKDDEKNRENVDLTETDFVVRDDEKNHGTRMTENPILEKESQKRNHEEIRKDQAELVIQALRERKFPLVLNHRRRRVQASKHQVDELNQERNHKQDPEPEDKVKLQNGKSRDTVAPGKKRVHFVEDEVQPKQDQDIQKLQSSHGNRLASRASKRIKYSNPLSVTRAQDAIRFLQTRTKNRKRLMFQNIEFLLTGISSQQEKEIKGLIRKYGGTIHPNIPPPPSPRKKTSNFLHIPIVLCLKKVQTTKFLFGCAVNAFILNVNWLTDSIAAGSILPPEKYMILSNHGDGNGAKIGLSAHHCNTKCIFARVGIMLQGKQNFCTKLEKIIKHGGGLVFKTLQLLIQSLDTKKISVGAIVAENKCQVSRHLRHCGSERKIAIMSGSWVIKSLHSGELIPFTSNMSAPTRRIVFPKLHISAEWSEEI